VNTLSNLASLGHYETEVFGELNYKVLAELSEEALQIARGFNWHQGEIHASIAGMRKRREHNFGIQRGV
jgi:hypothetical protein